MPIAVLAALLAYCAAAPAMTSGGGQLATSVLAGAKTGKERLSDKGSDEQRVDDCNVPATRHTRPRPTACPWDAES